MGATAGSDNRLACLPACAPVWQCDIGPASERIAQEGQQTVSNQLHDGPADDAPPSDSTPIGDEADFDVQVTDLHLRRKPVRRPFRGARRHARHGTPTRNGRLLRGVLAAGAVLLAVIVLLVSVPQAGQSLARLLVGGSASSVRSVPENQTVTAARTALALANVQDSPPQLRGPLGPVPAPGTCPPATPQRTFAPDLPAGMGSGGVYVALPEQSDGAVHLEQISSDMHLDYGLPVKMIVAVPPTLRPFGLHVQAVPDHQEVYVSADANSVPKQTTIVIPGVHYAYQRDGLDVWEMQVHLPAAGCYAISADLPDGTVSVGNFEAGV